MSQKKYPDSVDPSDKNIALIKAALKICHDQPDLERSGNKFFSRKSDLMMLEHVDAQGSTFIDE